MHEVLSLSAYLEDQSQLFNLSVGSPYMELQLHGAVEWLKKSLNADEIRICLRLSSEGPLTIFPHEDGGLPQLNFLIHVDDVIQLPIKPRQAWMYAEGGLLALSGHGSETLIPMFSQGNEPLGFILVHNPRVPYTGRVTALSLLGLERLAHIAQMIGLAAETWASTKNRSRLLEVTVHEFRSPVVAIRNTVDVLLKNWSSYSPERIHQKLSDIAIDAALLIRLTNNLDVLSGRALARQPKRVLLFKDIVFKTIRQLRPLAEHLVFEHEGVHRFPPLTIVEEEMSQILFNIIHNAIKYGQRDEAVRIRVIGGEERDYLTLKVQDWGIGIPSGLEESIFEPEFRAPNAIQRSVVGMGMGLAVSSDLARKMGGHLRLTRNQNPTEFTLYIDKAKISSGQEEAPA